MFFTGEWLEYIYAYRRRRRKDLENFIKKHIKKKCIFGQAVVQVTLNCELQKISKPKI